MPNIYINTLEKGYLSAVREGLDWKGLRSIFKNSQRISIKPNLTFPTYSKGVTTSPEALEALIICLKDYTDRITVCESDGGGYNKFSMDEVFHKTGIFKIAERYGVRIVNLTSAPSRKVDVNIGLRKLSFPLPVYLLDESDLVVNMPVPKVHLNTVVSLAIKNLWGVIQEPKLRLKLHPYFKEVAYMITKALPKNIVVVDGKYGLNRTGPLRGNVVNLNWILISDNIFYADYIVTDLMGLDYRNIKYLKYIFQKEGIKSLKDIKINLDHTKFKKERFYIKREWTDLPGFLTFNSHTLAYIGYGSILAKPLHWLLYKFRKPFY